MPKNMIAIAVAALLSTAAMASTQAAEFRPLNKTTKHAVEFINRRVTAAHAKCDAFRAVESIQLKMALVENTLNTKLEELRKQESFTLVTSPVPLDQAEFVRIVEQFQSKKDELNLQALNEKSWLAIQLGLAEWKLNKIIRRDNAASAH